MNPSEIAPTKTNLFDYKGQLSFSIDGHALLEEKREVLVMHLMEIISKIKEQRSKLNILLKESFELLSLSQLEMGEFELQKIVKSHRDINEVEVHEKSIMGVNIPDIKYKEELKRSGKPGVSFSSTTFHFDQLQKNMKEIMELIVAVSQIEASAWRLSYEIKKTQRRVNALENIFIPDFKEIIKFIQETLEERERETFFQMKRVKNAHEKA
jgi:V/A-type H+-transporting ATPase subunit D